MKAIKKLKTTVQIAILFIVFLLLLLMFEDYPLWVISLITISILFFLIRIIFFRDKDMGYEDYHNLFVYYIIGAVFLLFAIIFSIGTLEDLGNNNSIPFGGILALLVAWIFGLLITYYTYKAKRESPLKRESKPKDEIKKFNANYLIIFYILVAVIGFIFGIFSLTLKNIFVGIFILIAIYFLLRKFS